MIAIPNGPNDLTAAWFTDAIGEGAICTEVSSAPLGVGVGLVGQLHACDLTWTGPGSGERPRRVIAKLAAVGEESRFVAMVLNMYGREFGFYRELAEHTALDHPDCYYADHDPVSHDTVLLLEDVAHRGVQFDQIEGASLDDAEPALRAIARLHAQWWESETLAATPWLPRLCDDPYPVAVQMAYGPGWPNVQECFADQMTAAVRELGDNYDALIPATFAALCDGPLTLSHADWRLDNLFFTGDDAHPVIAVDWQLIDRSVGPRDVAYLVTQSLELSSHAEFVQALDTYLDELAANGVTVDREWAMLKYRQAARFGFVYPVVAGGSLTVEDPRHTKLCGTLLARCIAAVEALDAYDAV
jgi:hypothetical protein